jgi:hypothetical protein
LSSARPGSSRWSLQVFETLAVSDYRHDFSSSGPRAITFRLHGFHKNGLLDDTDFELELRLRFELRSPLSITPSPITTLVAALEWVRVSAHGIASGAVAEGIRDGVWKAFYRGGPDPQRSEVPDGSLYLETLDTGASGKCDGNVDVVDVMTTAQGGLQLLVPVGPVLNGQIGSIRQWFAQTRLDAMLSNRGCE